MDGRSLRHDGTIQVGYWERRRRLGVTDVPFDMNLLLSLDMAGEKLFCFVRGLFVLSYTCCA